MGDHPSKDALLNSQELAPSEDSKHRTPKKSINPVSVFNKAHRNTPNHSILYDMPHSTSRARSNSGSGEAVMPMPKLTGTPSERANSPSLQIVQQSSSKKSLSVSNQRSFDHKFRQPSFNNDHSLMANADRHDKTYLWSGLKRNCGYLLLEFLMSDISNLLCVCKSWNDDIKKLLSGKCSQLATAFSNQYHPYLVATQSQIYVTRSLKLIGWYRVDFKIRFQVRKPLEGLSSVVCHQYKMINRQDRLLYSSYAFDVLEPGEVRNVWLQREEYRKQSLPQLNRLMPLQQLKSMEEGIFTVSVWSGDGLMDLKQFKWEPLGLHKRSHYYTSRDRFLDRSFDVQRSCEIETVAHWRDESADPAKRLIPADYFLPCFERVEAISSGLDPIYLRCLFRAVSEGNRRVNIRKLENN